MDSGTSQHAPLPSLVDAILTRCGRQHLTHQAADLHRFPAVPAQALTPRARLLLHGCAPHPSWAVTLIPGRPFQWAAIDHLPLSIYQLRTDESGREGRDNGVS